MPPPARQPLPAAQAPFSPAVGAIVKGLAAVEVAVYRTGIDVAAAVRASTAAVVAAVRALPAAAAPAASALPAPAAAAAAPAPAAQGALAQTAAGLAGMARGLADTALALAGFRDATGRAGRALADAASGAVRRTGAAVGKAFRAVVPKPLRNYAGGVGRALARAGGGAFKAVKGIGKGVGGAASSFLNAFAAAPAMLMDMAGAARGFVQALAPSTVQVFDAALRDLQATVGVAVLPLFQVAAGLLREFANAMLPVANNLRPVFEQVGASVASVGKVWVNTFASLMTTLTPVVQLAADAFQAVTPVIQASMAVFSGLVEVGATAVKGLLSWAGIDTGSAMQTLKGALQELARGAILATAAVLKWVNAAAGDAFARGVRNALEGPKLKPQDTSGLAAASNAQIGGIQSWSQAVQRAALLAAGGAGKSKDEQEAEWRKKVLESLKGIEGLSSEQAGDLVKKKMLEVWDQIKDSIEVGIKKVVNEAVFSPAEWLTEQAMRAAGHSPDTAKSTAAVFGGVGRHLLGG